MVLGPMISMRNITVPALKELYHLHLEMWSSAHSNEHMHRSNACVSLHQFLPSLNAYAVSPF